MQIRDQRGLELIGTGARPLAVARDGVDFTVVRQIAERLRQRPTRHGVGGEALVEQADGRFQTQVCQVQVEARQICRHTQTFIDIDQIRQATDVEVFVLQETFFDTTTRDEQATLHITRTPARRGVNKNLLDTRQGGKGYFTENTFVGWHVAPAYDRQGLLL